MSSPILEEDHWVCQMCGQPKKWEKKAYIVGEPSCFLICKSCWHDLGQQFRLARIRTLQKIIDLPSFQCKRELLAHTIANLEKTLKQEARL